MISFHFREAQCDVDQVLVDLKQPRHSKALYVRAEAMYNLGNFEYALMNFHRAKKKCRPKVILLCHRCLHKNNNFIFKQDRDDISKGILRCELAIENSIGYGAGSFFKKMERILYKIPPGFMGLPLDQLKKEIKKQSQESKVRKPMIKSYLQCNSKNKKYFCKITL